ncbi:hypothetical protein JCM14244_16670 [Venenivibrio stagnispumantis]|uniref:Uncharacterized protein, contains HEPN domain, UPF0332 family n=1 Tax=Venenivibrio stagnispumantis TaxID=407998 RepID=A0AA45WQ99_9AQUI|nr:HEPN domain-containing protein [Venenivibrio stagnispumantis]MCW4573541.1 HEPN domain-containing protein [Venenivibrio stagnispumantis]SMP23632.1 Uncharacterized protein, contains HEPN domain, UPF0332 family [Venenivibrio stagnispumantis]
MFQWEDFITLSQKLFSKEESEWKEVLEGRSCEEALYRMIVSRCYYGIFKKVEDYLMNRFNFPQVGSSHEQKIRFLQNHNNRNVQEFGRKLRSLKTLRTIADYDSSENINRETAKDAIQKASELFQKWEEIINLL